MSKTTKKPTIHDLEKIMDEGVAEITLNPDGSVSLLNIAEVQDALCQISEAAFGGELAWEIMGLKDFAKAVADRMRPEISHEEQQPSVHEASPHEKPGRKLGGPS